MNQCNVPNLTPRPDSDGVRDPADQSSPGPPLLLPLDASLHRPPQHPPCGPPRRTQHQDRAGHQRPE